MKRAIIITLAVVVLMSFSMEGFAADRFMLSVSANYLAPADSQYKDIYGSSIIFPEIRAGFKLFMGMYVWGGFGFFSADGTTPILEREAKSKHTYFSGGVGYMSKILPKLSYKLEAGVFSVNYKEESMGLEYSDSAVGFRVDGGIVFNLTRIFFVEVSLGYLRASDTVIDNGDKYSVKLGGFRTGAGIGVRF